MSSPGALCSFSLLYPALSALTDKLFFGVFQAVIDIITKAGAVTGGPHPGQTPFAIFGQAVASANGPVFLRVINNLKLLLDPCNARQSRIQTACHFLVIGLDIAIQIVLDKVFLHLYGRFRIAAGLDLADMGNQDLSCINQFFGARYSPVPLNSYRFKPQQYPG